MSGYLHYAQLHFQLGLYEDAERCCLQVLERYPKDGDTLQLLGQISMTQQQLEKACDYLGQALEQDPDHVDRILLMADCQHAMKETQAAEANYRRLLALAPELTAPPLALGDLCRERGDHLRAWDYYQAVLALDEHNGYAHAGLGYCHAAAERVEQASRCFAAATAYAPYELDFQKKLFLIDKYNLALWHLGMMNDQVRNDAFQAAIEQVVPGAQRVLEIGTGSGLLAMMAARAGAGKVFTCESQARVAQMARRIVTENGYEGRVEVVHKRSSDLVMGQDLDQPADVLICEIFDSGLLAEDALFSIYHARQNLLRPHAAIIPSKARLFCALAACDDVADMRRVEQVNGFDLSTFNEIANRRVEARSSEKLELVLLSEPVALFAFDFNWDHQLAGQATHRVPVTKGGVANALVFWFELDLNAEISLSTHPFENQTHWQNPIQVLNRATTVKAGDNLILEAEFLRQFFYVDACFNQT